MRILHVLSQRPSLTGSGITLDAMVRHANGAGWEQRVVVGVPDKDPSPTVGGLDLDHIHPLGFGEPPLGFAVPGMSDVMPYTSTRFSDLDEEQVAAYRRAWTEHLQPVLATFRPQLIHSHHVWLLSALLKDLAAEGLSEDDKHREEKKIQALTNDFVDQIGRVTASKEEEILQV